MFKGPLALAHFYIFDSLKYVYTFSGCYAIQLQPIPHTFITAYVYQCMVQEPTSWIILFF